MTEAAIRILLIDDDEDDFRILRALLRKVSETRYALHWVANLDEALARMVQNEFDVYLLDYRLGARNGIDLLRAAKSNGCTGPVILTTGYGDPEVDMQAMAAGATDYLTKAEWTPAALERCIRYALEHVRSRQALVEAYEEMEREVAERTAELTAANEALKGSVEDMKRFAYSVCHDLKGPAIGIHGLTKRLYQRYGDQMDQKGQAHCRQIIRATEEIAALVENINTYIGAKEATLRLQPVRLQDVFAILWEDFADILSARDIAWKQPESLPTIYADYLGMLRIFRNLVENALKYGGEELTAIRIEYNDTDDHHIIAVRDDGPGIRGCPNRILSPFQRNSPSKDIPGNGLGLAIVKELATQHKGDVWFAPQNRVGCTIHVSISKHLQP